MTRSTHVMSYFNELGCSYGFKQSVRKCLEQANLLETPNYREDDRWGLLSLLEREELDTYQLVYSGTQFLSGSGGRVIETETWGRVYQAGVRTFAPTAGLGLSHYPSVWTSAVPIQIRRAKEAKIPNVIITFNEHNKRLMDALVNRVFHHRDVPLIIRDFLPQPGVYKVNSVDQHVLLLKLTI